MRMLKAILLLAAGSGVASANAFNINEADATATGRGDAVIASDNSPASISYNPGGVAVADGVNALLSGTLVSASGSFTDTGGTKTTTDSGPAVLPSAFVTAKVHDMVAVGVGFYLPFGLAISWPSSSPQNEIIENQSLRTYFISPVVGVNLDKFVPGLSIGGGVDIVPATVELKKAIIFGETQGQAHLGGTAVGIGGRVGVMYRPGPLPALSVGLMYRSQVNLDFKGTGDFDIDPTLRQMLPPDGDISTSIALPMSIAGGVSYRPMPNLELEANAIWMNWSKFKSLVIKLPDATNSTVAEDYKDTTTFRIGAEYKLPALRAAVRAGYIYDPTPIPTTTLTAQLPDANRNVVSVGGSYAITPAYGVSLGLLAVLPTDRTTAETTYMPVHKGSYGISAVVASLTLAGHFGK